MGLNARVTYRGFLPKMKRSEQNAVLRASYQDLGQQFFDVNLERRFTYAGGRTLNYQRRSPGYTKRKKRLFGHTNPLVWSGATRQRVLSSSLTKIVARAKKGQGSVVLKINAPALNFRRPGMPNMREEIERISTREIPPLERHLEKTAERRFATFKGTSQEKI